MTAAPRCPKAELAVGWALHALEPADEEPMLEHLPQCPICREVVQQTEELIWSLGPAHAQVEAPPGSRDRLLAAVEATPQTPKEQRAAPRLAPSGVPPGQPVTVGWHRPGETGMGARALERHHAREQQANRRRRMAIIATLLISIIGVGTLVYRGFQVGQEQQVAEADWPGQLNKIRAQVDVPGARYAILNAPGGEPVAGVRLTNGVREVLPFKLPSNDPQHSIYVLWGIGPDLAVPIAGFDVARADNGLRPVGSMSRADNYAGYAISIERGRTLPDSPQLVVASGQVAN